MKGTIYLWILAAVLSGALVGLLGFAIGGVFNRQSSVMEPVIVGAIAGRGGAHYDCPLPKREGRLAGQNFVSNYTGTFNRQSGVIVEDRSKIDRRWRTNFISSTRSSSCPSVGRAKNDRYL